MSHTTFSGGGWKQCWHCTFVMSLRIPLIWYICVAMINLMLFPAIILRNVSRGFCHYQGARLWEHRGSWANSADYSLQFPAQQTCGSRTQVCVSTQTNYTLRTGLGKPVKSWNFIICIQCPESHGIFVLVMGSHRLYLANMEYCIQQTCLLFQIFRNLYGWN